MLQRIALVHQPPTKQIRFEQVLRQAYNNIPMKPKLLFSTIVSSLMVASMACNSRAVADSTPAVILPPTSQPATRPTTMPNSPAMTQMRESLVFLTSDELEGRGPGTAGIDLAASFIAGSFHGSGLSPLPGMADYFQRFDLSTTDGIAPETTFSIGDRALKLKDEYNPVSLSAEGSFEGQGVFVGYGITSKEKNYDDYAGAEVKGKVAVAWRFEPADKDGKSRFTGKDWSDLAHLDAKAKNAAEHGAIALVLMNPPLYKGGDEVMPFAREYMGQTVAIPFVHIKRSVGSEILQRGLGVDAATLQEQIDSQLKPQPQPLKNIHLSGKIAVKRSIRHLKNVLAIVPGAGPHADEYVVVGAHYDHLGHGGFGSLSPKSKEIHHGADDNASGTAALMELAREFATASRSGHPPERSILFITFSAEEEGLIGSAYFVNHPSVPLDRIVAMLNLDMVGRLRDESLFVGGAGTAASLENIIETADKGFPLKLKDMGKGGRGPSDHMSFAMKKIPVLFFFTGLHADYHRPTDTLDKINLNGMAEIVEFSSRVIHQMATMPRESYITAADAHSMSVGMDSGQTSGTRRATLGVVPSYGDEAGIKGVRITGTSPGSPAEAAGLKDGDIIVGYNGKPLDSLMELSNLLAAGKPGDKIKLVVLRDKKEMPFEATLAERK
jgi:hypothetical protein